MVIAEDPEVAAPSDLLPRACAGDSAAFCRLTAPLQARLLRQAVFLCDDPSQADDLVSETLVEAWKCLGRYNQTCRLSTWLYGILLNRHRKSVRRARCRPIPLAWLPFFQAEEAQDQQAILPSSEASPAEAMELNEISIRIRQCVDRLPDKHREVVLLRFYENASLPDIAAVLGCSAGTVKSRLFHALEKLRKMKMNLPNAKGDTQV